MHHNHIDKDYSHPWQTPEKLQVLLIDVVVCSSGDGNDKPREVFIIGIAATNVFTRNFLLQGPKEGFARWLNKNKWARFIFPFVAWQVYLAGDIEISSSFLYTYIRN